MLEGILLAARMPACSCMHNIHAADHKHDLHNRHVVATFANKLAVTSRDVRSGPMAALVMRSGYPTCSGWRAHVCLLTLHVRLRLWLRTWHIKAC